MNRGLVISDLHLFSRRSDGDGLWREVGDELAEANILVLNGDIFDFRWSCLPDEEATISAALEWIDDLYQHSRWEAIHYVFGNHDCLNAFKGRLQDYAGGREGLQCHEFRLQLGRNLFLHVFGISHCQPFSQAR